MRCGKSLPASSLSVFVPPHRINLVSRAVGKNHRMRAFRNRGEAQCSPRELEDPVSPGKTNILGVERGFDVVGSVRVGLLARSGIPSIRSGIPKITFFFHVWGLSVLLFHLRPILLF